MTKMYSTKGAALLLFVALGAAGTIAAYLVANSKADAGRTLDGTFCAGLCIQLTSQNGTGQGQMDQDSNRRLDLRPGNYTLTVTDGGPSANFHNFALRSCPGAAVLCDQNSGGDVQMLTPINNGGVPTIVDTVDLHLSHGTYRLYCQAGNGGHEMGGMFVDIVVGGVGQVDSIPTVT